MSDPIIQCKQIGYAFSGGESILSGLSLTIETGEFVCFLGPSGCGKTTLIKCLSGLFDVTSGTLVRGKDAKTPAFVFQSPALLPWRRVSDNVSLPSQLTAQHSEISVEAALDLVGLHGLGGRYPHQLSGGQQMRVSIARALVSGSRFLLMDEPFAALDEMRRFRMGDLLLRLRHDLNLTIGFVTHSLYEASALADRALIMGKGQITDEIKIDHPPGADIEARKASPAFMAGVSAMTTALAGGGEQQ